MSPFKGLALALIVYISITITHTSSERTTTQEPPSQPNFQGRSLTLTQEEYSKVFRERRKAHTKIIKDLIKGEYVKNYKMIRLAFEKIFIAFGQTITILGDLKYEEDEGWSLEPKKQDALVLLVESTCLAADIFLHFPEISFRVMEDFPDWKEKINWCINFVDRFPITDKHTHQLLQQAFQEINEPYRDYLNPDYVGKPTTKKPKQKKKLKRGPALGGRSRQEL